MLKNTTILVQFHKNFNDTIHQALTLSDNVIVYDDASDVDLTEFTDKVTIVRSENFSGKYEVALGAIIDLVNTKYLMRVNAGDTLISAEEPKKGYDIFFAKYGNNIPNHKLNPKFYNIGSTSIISGSVIPTNVYKELLSGYSIIETDGTKFGKYCGQTLLSGKLKGYQSKTKSYDFTYNMWGGKEAFFDITINGNNKDSKGSK